MTWVSPKNEPAISLVVFVSIIIVFVIKIIIHI